MTRALRLVDNLLPAIAAIPKDQDLWTSFSAGDICYALANAILFDCRELPVAFVRDTGIAAMEEMSATEQHVILPGEHCYFEFSDAVALLAKEVEHRSGRLVQLKDEDGNLDVGVEGPGALLGTAVEIYGFELIDRSPAQIADALVSDDPDFVPYGEFPNGMQWPNDDSYNPDNEFFWICNNPQGSPHLDDLVNDCAVRLAGVLTLLNEKLVINRLAPENPRNAVLRQKGYVVNTPRAHVLTVNVPAVRATVARNPLGTHESPVLHWRRGHRRVLHRGSEFESVTWVKKCLVGDPDKGFADKSYRLTHHLPMLPATRQ